MLKTLRLLVVPAVLLLLAGTASASDLNIIIDPSFVVNEVGGTGVSGSGPVTVSWGSCPNFPGIPSQIANAQGCLNLVNSGNTTITDLTLFFTTPSSEPNAPGFDPFAWTGITCTIIDSSFSNASCPGETGLNQPVTIHISGGGGIAPGQFFFIGENGAPTDPTLAGAMPITTLLVPTHDPSTLVLLALGVAVLAMGGLRRYA